MVYGEEEEEKKKEGENGGHSPKNKVYLVVARVSYGELKY